MKTIHFLSLFLLLSILSPKAQTLVPVDEGWANNSVNTTVFRKNSLVSHGDYQFIAYYAPDSSLMLGKRRLKEKEWELSKTQYKGDVNDAHNVISIMVDGDGYLHVAWDHHGHPLRYARGIEPYDLQLSDKRPMTGEVESKVTYPEFFRMPNGDLLFMYRDGESGSGRLVLNRYDLTSKSWRQIHNNLIDGEEQRNAYWQACVDKKGVIHLSWVWRETWDVSTNHDMAYARSRDGGLTWEKSTGESYSLPINRKNSEYVSHIPENSELINQTSMTTNDKGELFIASYWREADSQVPQYHVIHWDKRGWKTYDLNFRSTPFSLKGGGTKSIPISRPQIVAKGKKVRLLFRDEERGSKVSVATCSKLSKNKWKIEDLTDFPVGSWEPSYDTELWKEHHKLHLFVQNTEQVDGEGKANIPPQPVYVLQVNE